MLLRSSFQKLSYCEKGLYFIYDLLPEEKSSFEYRFSKSPPDSKCLTCGSNQCFIFLELFIHEQWILKKFDIRKDIIKFIGREITEKEVSEISNFLKSKQLVLYVNYDIITNCWSLVEHSKIELLEKINEKIKEDGA